MTVQGLDAGDIERISVGCSHMTFVHTAWPYKPAGVTAAQMNLFYGLAVVALYRDASVRQYAGERLADPVILDFIGRISAFEDAGLEAMGAPFRHAARLAVSTRDGRTFRHERLARRGSPDDPVGAAEIVRKFDDNVRGMLSAEDLVRLRERVMQLDSLDDTADLAVLLCAGIRS